MEIFNDIMVETYKIETQTKAIEGKSMSSKIATSR